MKTYDLFTIGYEGRNIEEFISHLKDFNIPRLIDVRKIPLSRKKGFNKKAMKVKTTREIWVPAINNIGKFGKWAMLEVQDIHKTQNLIRAFIGEQNKRN